ncbi:MAG: hypothetical protein HND47_12340 [Chloroflexi bacterium]|nr:hypothetical protein [Chloroflexota bacterium]
MTPLLYALASLAILMALYFLRIRPWTLTWGATKEEAVRPLPGDDIVKKTHFIATRAVTIHAPPSEVWKWIVQIGSARAGWYSIDWIDNGGRESSRVILPEFQKIEQDYFIPFTPDQKNGMWVKEFKEPETIQWWDKKGNASWLWSLSELGQGKTRLVTRLRTKYDFKFPWVIYYILYDLGDIVMMSKCMLGIKQRAEKN